jgi:glycopeptide antibiotics resistance protein
VIPPEADGYEHLMIFALLGFLVEMSRKKRSIIFWACVLILYSFATEVLQGLLNPICHRFFTWNDLIQNILGVLIGIAIGYYFRPVIR